MRRRRFPVVVTIVLASSLSIAGEDAPGAAGEPIALVSVADSLHPLQDRFNELRDRRHFVALLSPT